jgi:hypothetical protein
VDTQVFTTVVYLCGAAGVLLWAKIADKTNARGLTLAISTIGAIVGYSILISMRQRNIQFFATCLVAFSMYPSIVLQLSWCAMCFPGYTQRWVKLGNLSIQTCLILINVPDRGSVLAFMNMFSEVIAIAGTQAYSDPPYCMLTL